MKDIRKPSHNLNSNHSSSKPHKPAHISRKEREKERAEEAELRNIAKRHERQVERESEHPDRIESRVERYERQEYDDIDYTRDGKPIMRASRHFDRIDNGEIRRKERDDFDVLKRNEFFNNQRRDNYDEETVKSFRRERRRKRKVFKILIYSLILLGLGFLAIMTFVFNRATVVINPKFTDVNVDGMYTIPKADFVVDFASSTQSQKVLKSEPKEVNQKATGKITIYNNYSDQSQVLIKNTRFESPEGKIFRIGDSVTVPGMQNGNPGTITVPVTADSYGSDYNIKPTTFTIPGLKGTTRYNSFSAKSDQPMTGGISGMVQIVSDIDIEAAKTALQPKVQTDLENTYNKITHDGYYTLYGMPNIVYSDNQDELMTTSAESEYKLTGLATIYSINKDDLAKMIAEKTLASEYNLQDGVKLDNIDSLSFSIATSSDPNSDNLELNITGRARIIWTYDSEQLKNKLKGNSKSTFTSAINEYNSNHDNVILNATTELQPSWLRKFPVQVSRINIVEKIN